MSSKFSNLLSQARNRPTEDETEAEQGSGPVAVAEEPQSTIGVATPPSTPKTKTKPAKLVPAAHPKAINPTPEAEDETTNEPSLRGRPRTGKRSDPNYTQITAYITKKTHRDIKVALLQEGHGREISEVIEECLAAWLAQQK